MSLPKDFEVEQSGPGKYLVSKIKSGDKVKFRMLTDFITGKSVWGDPKQEGKRVCTRKRIGEKLEVGCIGINKFSGNPESIKQFIAAIVWNYATEQVEIFETDKSTIIEQIFDIEADDDWGDSKGFDLSISKKGEAMETTYSLLPSNKSVFKCSEDFKHVNIEALYTGDDPFAKKDVEDGEQDNNEVDVDKIPF